MEKLRIEQKGLYEIEVNDKGETIVFDTLDLDLPFKFNDAFIQANNALDEFKTKYDKIRHKKSKEYGVITTNDEEIRKLKDETFVKLRSALDCFLGKGGCQKIFGDRNYPTMIEDLLEALQPHLEKLDLSYESTTNKIKAKYGNDDSDVMK